MSIFKRSFPSYPGTILILSFLLVHGWAAAQVKVTRIGGPEDAAGRNGLVYSLPRTALAIKLEITRTDKVPGPYAVFAAELLGIDNMITARKTRYSLDHACIKAGAEADPEQVFLVEQDEKASEEIFMTFSRNGLILGTSMMEEDMPSDELFDKFTSLDLADEDIFPGYKAGSMKESYDTIIRIVTFDTLTYEEKILKRLMVQQSDREKALDAASMIKAIGQDQYSLLVGYQETAYSSEALNYMIGQLEEQRKNYLQLFTGVTRYEKVHATLEFVPASELPESPVTIAGFSPTAGLVEPDGNNDITVQIVKKGITSWIGQDSNPASVPGGYFYRIPEDCEISIIHNGEIVGKATIPVNQLGVVRNLPPSAYQVEFYPETGGIKKVLLK